MFHTYWYISRRLYSKKMTFRSQSGVYPLSFKVNFMTGFGPVLSLFGLKDRRTGPFKKARTVDTLPFMKVDYLKILMKNSEPYSLGQYLVPQEHCCRGSAPDPSTILHFDGGHRTLGRM